MPTYTTSGPAQPAIQPSVGTIVFLKFKKPRSQGQLSQKSTSLEWRTSEKKLRICRIVAKSCSDSHIFTSTEQLQAIQDNPSSLIHVFDVFPYVNEIRSIETGITDSLVLAARISFVLKAILICTQNEIWSSSQL